MNKRLTGTEYEQKAVRYLEKNGYRILQRNYRCKMGEIDLIAEEEGYFVFLEVKYRKDRKMGYGAEAVDYRKQQRIIKSANWFLMSHGIIDRPCRFDVLSFDGENATLIRDAFQCGSAKF